MCEEEHFFALFQDLLSCGTFQLFSVARCVRPAECKLGFGAVFSYAVGLTCLHVKLVDVLDAVTFVRQAAAHKLRDTLAVAFAVLIPMRLAQGILS